MTTTPDPDRVRILADVDIASVVSGDPITLNPPGHWRTLDGQSLTDEQIAAVGSATSADLRAVAGHHRAVMLERQTELDWFAEFRQIIAPYHTEGTVEDALARMPEPERIRAVELARLALRDPRA